MDVAHLSTLRVIDTVSIGQELQALICVSSAVPWRAGTQGLERKGLGLWVKNILIPVLSRDSGWKRSALLTVRSTVGLDMFHLIGRDLVLNWTYVAEAELEAKHWGCRGVTIPLVAFNATSKAVDGCGVASQVAGLFKFSGV